MLDGVAKWLKDKYGILDLGPLGFENAYAFAMRKSEAERLGINSIADLAHCMPPSMKIGGDYEFFGRPEWTAVKNAYGLALRRSSGNTSRTSCIAPWPMAMWT